MDSKGPSSCFFVGSWLCWDITKIDPALQDPLGQSIEALKGQDLLLRRLAGVST